MADMRTPLNRVRGLGAARGGTEHFWRQRLTAVSNLPLILFFMGFVMAYSGAPFEEVRAAIASPVVALLIGFAFVSVLYHMRLGMQVIIEDYVHDQGWKVALIILNTFFPIVVGAIALLSLLKIVFGA
ncbi:succinate dehydrogenase, hydrophobic membrane anchor protein [Chelativorans sp. Marseille-P2723]|uniref:succinate dehydrogenase, hydrophobic membrane anchor protein n=1 Tax=Chelativorans sp. Marseille-P2723 TaxID=2709133 RepID=UPI00156EDA43|nr:succinate dehydrogenase, hydrophobic membrane anchor protein [Chelativorans sp. Marseille-P2723]